MGNQADADFGPSGLASLSITGFRGIDQLQIPRLGRVTLLAGKNGVGKTTVLEALRVYSAHGRFDTLRDMLARREELTIPSDKDDPALSGAVSVDRLFHRNGGYRAIRIGPIDGGPMLEIKPVDDLSEIPERLRWHVDTQDVKFLSVGFGNARDYFPWPQSAFRQYQTFRNEPVDEDEQNSQFHCVCLGPAPPVSDELARLWDKVVLTDDEALALDALRLVFGAQVERTALVGDGIGGARQRIIARLANHTHPVPLRSLGDGATRMFGIALALANCRNGLLLIDEVEAGVHYSLQSEFWKMVMRAAEAHNAQVVATTHSKDCINGFAAAALDCPDISGGLVRIDRHNGEAHAVEYSKEELKTAAEQNIEVR